MGFTPSTSVGYPILNLGYVNGQIDRITFDVLSYGIRHVASGFYGWTSDPNNASQGTLDTALARKTASVVEINNGTAGTYTGTAFSTGSQTVAQLPAAGTAGAGARSFVIDAATTLLLGLGTTVTGGGANGTPVYSDGTNWKYG